MKAFYLVFLFVISGLIFISVKNRNIAFQGHRQSQETSPSSEQLSDTNYYIRYEIQSKNDQPLADILWLQQAATLALEKKNPWFNVIEQKLSPGSIEGVIQLEREPSRAEYDANEILSLHLSPELLE